MGDAWTNQIQTFLVIPTGATTGARIAINVDQSGAILVYDASNHLVDVISPTAGTDPFGNTYPAGITAGDGLGHAVSMGLSGGIPVLYWAANTANVAQLAAAFAVTQGSGLNQYGQLVIDGQQDATVTDRVSIILNASSESGIQPAQLLLAYIDQSAVQHVYSNTSFSGMTIFAGSITAVHPGTGTAGTNAAVAETWQTPSLGTGWATGDSAAGYWPLQYRMQPDGSVWLFGEINSTSATPAATLFTLPSGYFNATNKTKVPIVQNVGTTSTPNEAIISTAGAVSLNNAVTATATSLVFDCLVRIV